MSRAMGKNVKSRFIYIIPPTILITVLLVSISYLSDIFTHTLELAPIQTTKIPHIVSSSPSKFVTKIEVVNHNTGRFSKSVCMEINQRLFWVKLRTQEEKIDSLVTIEQVKIDEEILTPTQVEITKILPILIHYIFYEEGQRIGWYPDPFTLCLDASNLKTGLHKGYIHLKTISGVEYSHTWIFQITDSNENQIEVFPTVFVLPSLSSSLDITPTG